MVEIQEFRLKFSLWLPGSCLLVANNGTVLPGGSRRGL